MSNCHHEHCEIHEHKNHEHEEKTNKLDIIFYIISIILFIIGLIPQLKKYQIFLHLACILLSGYKLILEGIVNIFKLNFEEDTLMIIATVAAFVLGEFPESCMIILLFKLGEFLEDKAVENSNKNIKNIVEIKAKTANVIYDEKETQINVEEVKVGQKIIIKPGEMVPLDCKIIKGTSSLDMSALTGESMPVEVIDGQSILSGSINLNGSLIAIVEKDYKNSTASQIADLVYEATNNKGKTEKFITKFSKIYTPVVIIIALVIAIFVPIISRQEFKTWILRSLVFLVASCPCSIVISVPLAFFSCIGAISRKGMLIKGTKHIENLSKARCIAFDKTGTVTTGKMQIDKINTKGNFLEEEILKYMYAVEKNSNHPISTAIKQKVENLKLNVDYTVENYEEIAGHGIKAIVNNKEVLFGNSKLLEKYNIRLESYNEKANYLVIDGKQEGFITLKEDVRENIKNIIQNLKDLRFNKIVMLTGDSSENASKIADAVGIEDVYSGLLPQEKQEKLKELKKISKVIFVGDGINDSPVLAESNFGISMGEGTEIANTTSDAILISNNLEAIPKSIKIARKSMRIINENIVFSLVAKAIVLTLGIMGIAPVWLAVIADTGVSLITVLNSLRIFK